MEAGTNNIIHHDCIVLKAGKDSVLVKITSASACSGCHAEGACGMTGKEDKFVKVQGCYGVSEGDSVTIIMERSMGYRAVLLGYVLPFFAVITLLAILNSEGFPELTSGLLSISALIPYYALLFLFRKKIDKEFTFSLKI